MPHSSVLTFKGPDSASRAAAAVGALVVALLVTVVAVSTWQYRNQAREAALEAAEDLAFALAVHAQQSIDSADYVADAVQRAVERRQFGSSQELAQGYATEVEHQWLRSRHTSFGGLNVVSVVDAQGRLVNTSFAFPPPAASFGDHEAFTAARDQPATPYISAPVISRITGRWTIYLSRPLKDQQERFMGAVLVGLSPKLAPLRWHRPGPGDLAPTGLADGWADRFRQPRRSRHTLLGRTAAARAQRAGARRTAAP